MADDSPEYVREMLSESYTRKAGIFNYDSVSSVIARIRKTEIASEVDNMVLTAVVSSHLLNSQFIDGHNSDFIKGDLRNIKIVEDTNIR